MDSRGRHLVFTVAAACCGCFVSDIPLVVSPVIAAQQEADSSDGDVARVRLLKERFEKLASEQENDAAIKAGQEVLAILHRIHGAEHSGVLDVVERLALLQFQTADYPEAQRLYERAVETSGKLLGEQHEKTAFFVHMLGLVHHVEGRYDSAVPLYERAYQLRLKVLGPKHDLTAQTMNNLAMIYIAQENYAAAEPLCRQSLVIREEALGPDHPDVAFSVSTLGDVLSQQSRFKEAEANYRRALQIREKTRGVNDPETALSLTSLALFLEGQGNYSAAAPLLRRAVTIYLENVGPHHNHTATALNNLAANSHNRNRLPEAQRLYERALEAYERSLGVDHPDTANCRNNFALLLHEQGKSESALPLFQEALASSEKVLGPEHSFTATCLNNIAKLHHDLGTIDKAEEFYRRSLKRLEGSAGPQDSRTIQVMNNLAYLLLQVDRLEEARATYHQVRQRTLGHAWNILPGLSRKEQSIYLAAKYDVDFHNALSVSLHPQANSDLHRDVATWLLNGKAVGYEALAARGRELRDEGSDASESATRRDWIELDRVRDALSDNEALIDIARIGGDNAITGSDDQPRARYAAWITLADGQPSTTFVDLGDAQVIDRLVENARQKMTAFLYRKGSGFDELAAVANVKRELRRLAVSVLFPILKAVPTAKSLVLCPDAALWLAPWSALPSDETQDLYLIERCSLRFVVSARDLVATRKERTAAAPVILANPEFDQEKAHKQSAIRGVFNSVPSADDDSHRRSFQFELPKVRPLPNTEVEARAIQPHIRSYCNADVTLYRQQYALERVVRSLHGPGIVTFATHGFFLPRQAARSLIKERSGLLSSSTAAADMEGNSLENPLLRCGLLLAGCNNRQADVAEDDGILTGLEIVDIDLNGTELVVLSACETGVGDVRHGEGVAGLRQAFQLAGAESVVSTLWQVPDRDTSLLMKSFFEKLAGGASKADALRRAQIERIQQRRKRNGAAHPFFWAAFTLTGS